MHKAGLADVPTAVPRKQGEQEARALVPALTVVSHPLARRVGDRLVLRGLLSGKEVHIARNHPDFVPPGRTLGEPLTDPFLSRQPVVLAPARNGAVRLLAAGSGTQVVAQCEPVREGRDFTVEDMRLGVPIELSDRVVVLLHLLSSEAEAVSGQHGMVGQSAAMARVRTDIRQVADLDVPVLIRGETGTGKELVARAIHESSPRKHGRLVSVNLGSMSRELGAAALFGAQKGAFTGAIRDQEGFFRAAAGGTLFLDEVGEASPDIQVMLLRALETGEIYPIGAQTPIAVNVRIIAATDADLEKRIQEGSFKAPLMHRLAGYEIRLPPLRERREDAGLLLYHFAREELDKLGEAHRLAPEDPYAEPWLPAALAARLVCHPWPGNIRQLRNITRQMVIGSRGLPRVQVAPWLAQHLDEAMPAPPVVSSNDAPPLPSPTPAPARRKPSEITESELVEAMRAHAWDLKAAADALGIPRSSIYDLIDRSPNLRTAGDLGADEIVACFEACKGDLDAMVQRLEVSRRALQRRIRELGLGSGDS